MEDGEQKVGLEQSGGLQQRECVIYGWERYGLTNARRDGNW